MATWLWIQPAHLEAGIAIIADHLVSKGRLTTRNEVWDERIKLDVADVGELVAKHPQVFAATEQCAGDEVQGRPGFAHLVITHQCAAYDPAA